MELASLAYLGLEIILLKMSYYYSIIEIMLFDLTIIEPQGAVTCYARISSHKYCQRATIQISQIWILTMDSL